MVVSIPSWTPRAMTLWITDPPSILADGAERGIVTDNGQIIQLVPRGAEPATPGMAPFEPCGMGRRGVRIGIRISAAGPHPLSGGGGWHDPGTGHSRPGSATQGGDAGNARRTGARRTGARRTGARRTGGHSPWPITIWWLPGAR